MNFSDKVYTLCKKVPKGKVTTYKEISQALGTKAYQAVGNALRCNPYVPKVPCHRVVKSNGELGGFKGETSSNSKEIKEKVSLLRKEGIKIINNKINLKKYLYKF